MAELQGAQDLELVDGQGLVRATMVAPPVEGLPACEPGRHCAHHGSGPHPCCRCGAQFEPLKRCACGREYDRAGWKALPFVGVHGDDVELSELRNCEGCHSTLAAPIEDLTDHQRRALVILAESGTVFPGPQIDKFGCVWARVNVSTLISLKRRGLLTLRPGPDGGMMGVQMRGAK